MVWFFERANQVLELETRYDNDTSEYVLEQRIPGEPPRVERFSNQSSFHVRLQALETSLSGQQWKQKGPPLILPAGWPNITPRH